MRIEDQIEGWTFAKVEERLVEAMQFQWRTESAAWGFASDGPWHLIVRDWWDWAAHEEKPVPRIPLSREQIVRRQRPWHRFKVVI
jgi:hypothetical protein